MKKVILSAAIIASLGTATFAQGIQPVLSTQASSPESLRGVGVGSLAGDELALLAAAFGITVIALIAILNDDDDATNTTNGTN